MKAAMVRPGIGNLIARIILGLLFVAGGAMTIAMTPPATPGLAGAFNDAFHASRWAVFVGVAQVVAGALLLVNRYVPVALIIIAGFMYNSFAFHLTMMPPTVIVPIVVIAIWVVAAWPYRTLFAPIFQPKP